MAGIGKILKRVLRVLPAVLILSAGGVLVAHFVFRVPTERIPVVVSVPLISLFLVGRILILILPERKVSEQERKNMRPAFFLSGLGFILCALLLVAALISAVLYGGLGLTSLMQVFAFKVAPLLTALTVICFFLMVLVVADNLTKILALLVLYYVLTLPERLGDRILIVSRLRLSSALGQQGRFWP